MIKVLLLLLVGVLVDACGGGGAAARRGLQGVVMRGPQLAQVTTTTAVVAWRSDAAEIGTLEFGVAPALDRTIAGTAPGREHVFTLTGLAPGTRYAYRVSLGDKVVSAGHEFTTASDDPSAPLRVVVIGDSGDGGPEQYAIAARIAEAAPDLLLHTGDVIYPAGEERDLREKYFEPYRGLVDRIPFYIVLGNHDADTQPNPPVLDAVHMPVNGADGSERYYSFDRGPVHFVGIDTTFARRHSPTQRSWLEQDLAATQQRWTIVFCHHPPYSPRRDEVAVRGIFSDAFERNDVDLVLTGHDHIYARSLPLKDGVALAGAGPDYVDPPGPIYVITGGGGKDLYQTGDSPLFPVAVSLHHLVRIDIAGDTLTLTAVDMAGAVVDRISITKR